LCNLKHTGLTARHGPDAVGLLTGDQSINPDAPVVVMTTEVLRNMLYADSPALRGLGYVVMDEVHYLADRFRGPVWEEVIIHLPAAVQVVSLSATVSNAEELGEWLDTVRGDTEVVVSEHRPVPLWQHMMTPAGLLDLFVDDAAGQPGVNPDLLDLTRDRGPRGGPRGPRGGPRAGGRRPGRHLREDDGATRPAGRVQVLRRLDADGLLPAITFIFSRVGCEAAVSQCLAAGLRLTTPRQAGRIRRIAVARCADLPATDLAALGYDSWLEGLTRGLAAHHAGMLPTFKAVVEDLFAEGLIKAVFATETLALGINMPARTVVLEKLVKFNGESLAAVTAGEYTQLTGRAGRRGIDVEGHAVVVWRPGMDPHDVAALASRRTYPLRSSFRPTSNMAVNLVDQVGAEVARTVLESSFAQFQADRAVVGLARQVREQDQALAGYAAAMTCERGDFAEYAALRERLARREKDLSRQAWTRRRGTALASLETLRVGDVVRVPTGRRAGFAVVLDPGAAAGPEGPRPLVLTLDRRVRRIALIDLTGPLEPIARLRIPPGFQARNPTAKRDLASSLRNLLAGHRQPGEPPAGEPVDAEQVRGRAEIDRLRSELAAHPCHGCDEREQHARWGQRFHRLKRERDGLARRIEGRTNTIARAFDRICDLLVEFGYLAVDPARQGGLAVTADGRRLKRIYTEKELLVAECLRTGAWSTLRPAELAAVAAAVVYEARRESSTGPVSGRVGHAVAETARLWETITAAQQAHRLEPMPDLDLGLVAAVHAWAGGASLERVLRDNDLAAGDLVRWVRQVIDLLGQLAQACSGPTDARLAATARAASAACDRGVVALGSSAR
jgi:ATP-dependent RNA helicase HelY